MSSENRESSQHGFSHYYGKLSLGVQILIWMAMGGLLGWAFEDSILWVEPVGTVFIRLLMMAAVPLVFFNLFSAITKMTDRRLLGKLGVGTIVFYSTTTIAALSLGLLSANWIQPGVGMALRKAVDESTTERVVEVPAVGDAILDLFPSNVFAAFAEGKIAQLVVFAILLGIAAHMLPSSKRDRIEEFSSIVAELLRKLIDLVMKLAPIGVAALTAVTVAKYGTSLFGPLGWFLVCVWGAQAVMVLVYLTLLVLVTRRNPITWLRQTATLYATTVSTCSSLASLSVSMDVAAQKLKLPQRIYGFTLPLGAQLNKDGTSIMLSVILLFTAQAMDPSQSFTILQQIQIVVIGLLISEGSGGIPGGGMVIALIFVTAFNLPPEIAFVISGVYRLIDMGSTTVNCMGDMTWTTIAADRLDSESPE